MRHRSIAVATAVLVALASVGCAERQMVDVPDEDVGEADTTPFVEPASPPASDLDLPDEQPDEEGGVPEDDEIGTSDGEESGAGDEPDEPEGVEDDDL